MGLELGQATRSWEQSRMVSLMVLSEKFAAAAHDLAHHRLILSERRSWSFEVRGPCSNRRRAASSDHPRL